MEVPTIYKAYVREYPHNIWPYMVQYLHFRILQFPLIFIFFRVSSNNDALVSHQRSQSCPRRFPSPYLRGNEPDPQPTQACSRPTNGWSQYPYRNTHGKIRSIELLTQFFLTSMEPQNHGICERGASMTMMFPRQAGSFQCQRIFHMPWKLQSRKRIVLVGLCWFMTRQSVDFELDILKLGHTLYDMLPSQPNPSRAQWPVKSVTSHKFPNDESSTRNEKIPWPPSFMT